jgi:hypothetical protein
MAQLADESWNDAPGMRRGGEPERLFIRFEKLPKQNAERSREAGRPVYEDVEYIEIAVPGDKSNIVHKPVTDEHRRKYRAQYADWKSGQEDAVSGTPLSEWTALGRSQVEELLYFKIRTVEQLASVSDGNLQHLGHGYLELRRKAADYLAAAKDNQPLLAMREELATRDNTIATMQAQLKQLGEALERARAQAAGEDESPKRSPGRPRKSDTEA